jgi:hypothetical protein
VTLLLSRVRRLAKASKKSATLGGGNSHRDIAGAHLLFTCRVRSTNSRFESVQVQWPDVCCGIGCVFTN